MASLSFIMDANDDHPTDTRSTSNTRHVTTPGLATTDSTEQDINQAAPAGQTRQRGTPSQGPKSASATSLPGKADKGAALVAVVSSTSSSSPSLSASTARRSTRRRSTTTEDSMDRSRYGQGPSSFSMGRRLQRPMPMPPAPAQFTPKITPKTGRVSKAKKGLPVHVCEICNPPKTFTRAEHLRRHQLGHGEPRFQCSGCDKSFHRADLLARHQQKHEDDGDHGIGIPKLQPARRSPHPPPAAPSSQAQNSPRAHGLTSTPSPSVTAIPPSPSAAVGSQSDLSHIGDSAPGDNAAYRAAPCPPSQDFHNTYTPTLSIVDPARSSSLAVPYLGALEYQPRNGPPTIYVVTQGLESPSVQSVEVPELHDGSAWPSSASDSTYSTPVSDVSRNPRLSSYPSTASRGLLHSAQTIEGIPAAPPPLFLNSYSNDPSEHTYGSTLGVPSMGYSTTGACHRRASLTASTDGTPGSYQHRHINSLSSAHRRSPPLNTSSPGNETLLASSPGFSNRLDSVASINRRKGFMMEAHQDLLSSHAAMGPLAILDGLAVAYGAGSSAASPGADNASHSSGIIAELDLALEGRCAMPTSLSMTIPLPGPVLAAIPRYLDIYWSEVDLVMPLIHRPSFEAAPEDILRCAMAAVATQHLDNREDRTRGNQLHEFAWQEVKRVTQWSLQTMQAILLCEYFARFRGRKAVTRPSRPFESLFSRILYHNPAYLDHTMLATDQHHLSVQQRWHSWIVAESRRRLLAACVFCDEHAGIYHQQRRAQDSHPSAALQPLPLLGGSTKLWEALSAEEWTDALAADPAVLQPEYVPPLEHLTFEDIVRRPQMDRMIIAAAFAQRLPRRHRPGPASSLSANSSPTPELDPQMHHPGSPSIHLLNNNQPTSFLRHQPESSPQPDKIPSCPSSDAEERISTIFGPCPVANTYLALHHTPLRDLLAVGGDSWVFSQKVLPATSFHEHQKRLKVWVTSTSTSTSSTTNENSGTGSGGPSVVRATVYAARAILGFLARQPPPPSVTTTATPHARHPQLQGEKVSSSSSGGECSMGKRNTAAAPWSMDMSDYWAMYVCALICWAFCHQHQTHNPAHRSSSCRSGAVGGGATGRGGISPVPAAAASASRPQTQSGASASAADDEEAVIAWLGMVAAQGVRPEDVVGLRGRREAAGVVGLVRRRLEADCLGGRSRLYVDAVGVLRKIEEGVGWKWF
ncbi:hypothetical protein N657DRAFT_630674 [Parathielavia appendiculata]|uniref:C2H2-type domain-containing protein n=1 Tax=Parathielavia appendiculata TaxID=2587402 RepID=A0AAN6U5A8_9PEZI|nr:hypothetical protein N657DRAFT_630674 [Parathielavia appendiculata]